jgi:hypothetical protein
MLVREFPSLIVSASLQSTVSYYVLTLQLHLYLRQLESHF